MEFEDQSSLIDALEFNGAVSTFKSCIYLYCYYKHIHLYMYVAIHCLNEDFTTLALYGHIFQHCQGEYQTLYQSIVKYLTDHFTYNTQ